MSTAELLSFLPALLATSLLVLVLLRYRRHKTDSHNKTDAQYSMPDSLFPAPGIRHPDHPQAPSCQYENIKDSDGVPPQTGIDVEYVDLLTEAGIFIEFGYLDRAAHALRSHIEQQEAVPEEILAQLARLYLELKQLDDYCDILQRRQLDPGGLRQAITAGLAHDRNHLPLRVLAEERLAMTPDAITSLLQDSRSATPAIPAPSKATTPEPIAATGPASKSEITLAADKAAAAAHIAIRTESACTLFSRHPAKLSALDRYEQSVIGLFLPPRRRARLLLLSRATDAALPALRAALQENPGQASLLIDMLQIHYQHHNIDAYAQVLWQLYGVLGEEGHAIKEKLLHCGLSLGYHSAFQALAEASGRMELEAIGQRYSFTSKRPRRTYPLQLVSKTTHHPHETGSTQTRPQEEAEQYLAFGQLDQALNCLEQAILCNPRDTDLYAPLFELYAHMEDPTRLNALQRALQLQGHTPAGDILTMMNTLSKNLQQHAQVA